MPEHNISNFREEKLPDASVNLLEANRQIPVTNSTLNRYVHVARQFWILEVLCIFLAVGALAGMIGLLVHLDNSTLASWTLKLGPNTVVSILANICRALLVTVIATCIAQLRWPYFASAPQRLSEFDTFDEATRGPWGALKFLFVIPFTKDAFATIASFGACLMIFAIAIDPFAQQMLTFETKAVPSMSGANFATMPVNDGLANGNSLLGRRDAWQAIYGGFLGFDYPMPYSCPGGNCTWPNFVSLGLCGVCQDAAPLMSFHCASGSTVSDTGCSTITSAVAGTDIVLTLQNGSQSSQAEDKSYTFVSGSVGPNYPYGYGNSTLFQFVTAQLLVSLNEPVPTPFRPEWNLTFCSAQWCAKVYENVTVSDGTLMQPEIKNYELYADTTSSCAGSDKCQQFETRDPLGVPGTETVNYIIDITEDAADVGQLFRFDDQLSASANGTWNLAAAFSVTGALFWGIDMALSTARSADTFTDYLRANHEFSANVPGVTLVRTTFIKVRWAWIGLPIALVILSMALLGCVVAQAISGPASTNRFVWKSSILPLLFVSQTRQTHEHRGSHDLNALAVHGNQMRGQFLDNGNGGLTFTVRNDH